MSDPTEDSPIDPTLITSSLVHELRQPLFALRGRIQLLHRSRQPVDDAALKELVGQLEHIESLLEYYGQPGGLAVRGRFDARAPVHDVLALLGPRAEAAGI
ncbi:MAG: histidine kinase dimerization/phospho-acceptor domain-containing protein, partial [Myxococcota bacterium]